MVHEIQAQCFHRLHYALECHSTLLSLKSSRFCCVNNSTTVDLGLFWYCFRVFSGLVPSPHLPSGMAFSWMGDGFWKPEADNPSSTCFERSNELNSIPSLIRTSSVRVLDCSSCAAFTDAAIFLLRLGSVLRRWINELRCESRRPLAHRNRNAAQQHPAEGDKQTRLTSKRLNRNCKHVGIKKYVWIQLGWN